MVYLVLNNRRNGTSNAYLNGTLKEVLDALLLEFSEQTKHGNDRRVMGVIPDSVHTPK